MNDVDLERELRDALHREAAAIVPGDRRAAILAAARATTDHEDGHRGWLAPVASAAAVAAIAGGLAWGLSQDDEPRTPLVPAVTTSRTVGPGPLTPTPSPSATTSRSPSTAQPSPSATTTPSLPATTAPSPSGTTGPSLTGPSLIAPSLPGPSVTGPSPSATPPLSPPSTAGSPTSAPAPATTSAALPAYFVGSVGDSTSPGRYGLYREFLPATLPLGATDAERARAAVALAMNAQPLTNLEPYLQPWSGTSVTSVSVTGSRITVTLDGSGPTGFDAAQTRLAVQELVWTAQAAVGRGTIPVTFAVTDGSTRLFGTYPTSATYNRSTAAQGGDQDLAPIWVMDPPRGRVLPAGSSVVVTGQATVWEAALRWRLSSGAATVASGATTASAGAPARGSWRVDVGPLPAGDYTFVAYATSARNGTDVVAQTSRSFTVR